MRRSRLFFAPRPGYPFFAVLPGSAFLSLSVDAVTIIQGHGTAVVTQNIMLTVIQAGAAFLTFYNHIARFFHPNHLSPIILNILGIVNILSVLS